MVWFGFDGVFPHRKLTGFVGCDTVWGKGERILSCGSFERDFYETVIVCGFGVCWWLWAFA